MCCSCFSGIARRRNRRKLASNQAKQPLQFSGKFVLPEEGSVPLFNLPFGTLTFNRTRQNDNRNSELCFEAEDASISDEGIFALIDILGKVFAASAAVRFVLTFDFRLAVGEPVRQLTMLYKILSWNHDPSWLQTLSKSCAVCRVAVLPDQITAAKRSMDKFFNTYSPLCCTYLLDTFDGAIGSHVAMWTVGAAKEGTTLAAGIVGGLGTIGSAAGQTAVSAALTVGSVGMTAVEKVREAVNEPLPDNRVRRDILVPWIP